MPISTISGASYQQGERFSGFILKLHILAVEIRFVIEMGCLFAMFKILFFF